MQKLYNKNINFLPKDLELTSEGGEKHYTELLVLKFRQTTSELKGLK